VGHTIETFNNVKGGNSFYKAISHPAVADKAKSLVGKLEKSGPIALYDPLGFFFPDSTNSMIPVPLTLKMFSFKILSKSVTQ